MLFVLATVILLGHSQQTIADEKEGDENQCGGHLADTHGYITTPNFPDAFPTPLSCKWVFYAPLGKKVVLYFTQYYLKELFNVVEYDQYVDESNNTGRYEFDNYRIQEDHVAYLEGNKSYLVFTFRVLDMDNIHLRVADFLLEVYGFNITYEVMPANESVRSDVCTVSNCSHLGKCLVSKDFTEFKCHCFPGYWGNYCQYGPYCNPRLGYNLCENGGKCR